MSYTFDGLSRRVAGHVHDRATAEELSHIVEEASEPGADASDVLIELALGDEGNEEDYDEEGEELADATEDDEIEYSEDEEDYEIEYSEDEEDYEGDEEEDEELDEELDGLDEELDGLGEEDSDDDLMENSLRFGEVAVI